MRDPRQRTARLVDAIEDLVAQEALALRAGEFTLAREFTARVAPLLADLAASDGARTVLLGDPDLQNRIRGVHALRRDSSAWLEAEMARVSGELQETSAARGRVARIAPVYGQPAGAATSRLNCVG